ncbi:hypothetical protein VM1G_03080 [Cytospora mali]|uniref:Uncharacterized protein n=1 Tax=Cytospora mali TaxID=578113 RepID=A0A194VW32_CYTMA|nr:hypothetical protein VM1G_03080 [Valsa mali]
MSTRQNQTQLSPLERYIQSFSDLDQEELEREKFKPSVHHSYQKDEDGFQLGSIFFCSGHDGDIITHGVPDISDEQAPRIRRSDCLELLNNWLSIPGEHITRSCLCGNWTIDDWDSRQDNSVVVAFYKTMIFRLSVEDPTQTAEFGTQDLCRILTAYTTKYESHGAEMPSCGGDVQYHDPIGVAPHVYLRWQIIATPKEILTQTLHNMRQARLQAAERRQEQRNNAIIQEMIARRPQWDAIKAMKQEWGFLQKEVDEVLETERTDEFRDYPDEEFEELIKSAGLDDDQYSADAGVDYLPLTASDRARLILETDLETLQIHEDRKEMQHEHEKRIWDAQMAIMPQAVAARDSAVRTSLDPSLYDDSGMPRAVDVDTIVHDTWTDALEEAMQDPRMYGASVAPSPSAMTVNAVDHLLDSINSGVIGYEESESGAGCHHGKVSDYQERDNGEGSSSRRHRK